MCDETAAPAPQSQPPEPLEANEVERRFAELEALARTKPELTQRIPPFSFTPLADVLEGQDEFWIELASSVTTCGSSCKTRSA